jgi:hypothetical protein
MNPVPISPAAKPASLPGNTQAPRPVSADAVGEPKPVPSVPGLARGPYRRVHAGANPAPPASGDLFAYADRFPGLDRPPMQRVQPLAGQGRVQPGTHRNATAPWPSGLPHVAADASPRRAGARAPGTLTCTHAVPPHPAAPMSGVGNSPGCRPNGAGGFFFRARPESAARLLPLELPPGLRASAGFSGEVR